MNRGVIERTFARALRELDPAARVTAALFRSRSWSWSRVHVIAIGKAAPAMAAGALDSLGDAVARCLVVAPDGTDVASLHAAAERAGVRERVETMRAGHPLPDARSVRAGRACLGMAQAAAAGGFRDARLVVLVSGGASALACAPAPQITLKTKRAITRTMLDSGASIQDVNVVRKHLSQLKGGGLLRAAGFVPVYTLVVSDVIGGVASDVGSGPSVPDVSTVRDARRLVSRYAPRFAHVPLVPTLVRTPAVGARARARLVASPEDLARAIAALLRESSEAHVSVRVLRPSQASVESLAEGYVALALRAGARSKGSKDARQVFVRAAEPSVEVTRTRGRGGRCTHLAALVGNVLGERGERDASARATPPRVVFAALASDGVDGGSGAGGAIIDASFARRAAAELGDGALARALARFDTGALHRSLGTAIGSRPTGHNLADVHVLIVG